ncbi:DUF58 domain-containing protein [Dasania marina]|uniref:DUF58 domain-containing protein n=1 Tax=Dasania marina TaxID=471499 RepID=UPI0030DB9C56|tara:strand:- start:4160 stop:5155 length:996 start_codon:yes stop_codon:yes gene_type:complete
MLQAPQQSLQHALRQRFQRWLDKRLPPSREHLLHRRTIFIFLSPAGYGFCALLLLLFVVAVNYQNNMVFALLFMLFGLLIVSLFHCYMNLSGLRVSYHQAANTFVGDSVPIKLLLSSDASSCFAVRCQWQQSVVVVSVGPGEGKPLAKGAEKNITLHVTADKRGWLQPPRLLVESYYPLGLFRSWSWLAIELQALIYPAPQASPLGVSHSDNDGEGAAINVAGSDDFYGFQSYQPGHSLKHVHWQSFAKGQPLQTKEFAAQSSQAYIIDWATFSGTSEQRLSAMCYWVLQFSQQPCVYSLLLPNAQYGPGSGEAFKQQLLRALALYPASGR